MEENITRATALWNWQCIINMKMTSPHLNRDSARHAKVFQEPAWLSTFETVTKAHVTEADWEKKEKQQSSILSAQSSSCNPKKTNKRLERIYLNILKIAS